MKVKVIVTYPWAGIEPDTCIIDLDNDSNETEIRLAAEDVGEDMIFDHVDISWEVIK